MNLVIGLAAVDRVTGEREMQRLANGWMGWESKTGRRVRAALAGGLVTLAARIAPAPLASAPLASAPLARQQAG